MQPYPHIYTARATGGVAGSVQLDSLGLERIESAPPPQFGGQGDKWSPETLLIAAVADCFVLTFRAISRVGRLEWNAIDCSVDGKLERVDGVARFSRLNVAVRLTIATKTSESSARKLLKAAEEACLISNSLKADRSLEVSIDTAGREAA